MPDELLPRPPSARAGGTPIYTAMVRERLLVETFVSLADTLGPGFDAAGMLAMLCDRSVELLGVADAGVHLAGDGEPTLSVAAVSSERARRLGTADTGPWTDCLREGEPVTSTDLRGEPRWPRFAADAVGAGMLAALSLPMQWHGETIGVLTLLHTEPGGLEGPEVRVGRALAEAAAIGLLHRRALRRAQAVVERLQAALSGRVVVEQAKGVLAVRTGRSPDEAAVLLERHAREHGLELADVARRVVEGGVDPALGRSPNSG